MNFFKFKTRRGKLDLGEAGAVWMRFGQYTRAETWPLGGAFAGALGVIAMQVLSPWPIKIIFDYILSDNMGDTWLARTLSSISSSPETALAWVCGAVLVIALSDAVFSYFRDILLAQSGQKVVGKIRSDLFNHIQKLSPSDLGRRHTATLLTRLTGDIQMLRQMLINAVINAGENCLLIVVMIAVMFLLNPLLALLGICMIPLMLWSSFRISKQIRKSVSKQRERESEIASIAEDVMGALAIVQAFNREPIEKKRFSRQNRSSMRAGVKVTRLEAKLYRIVSFSSAVGLCAILYVGVRSVISGAMTAGDLLVFVSYLRAVNKPMRKIAKLAGQVAKATACGQRIAEIFNIDPSIKDRKGAVPLQTRKGEITFNKVTFAYNGSAPALNEITLTLPQGSRTALVGQTGAGKSTLVKLLLRFYDPQDGTICMDGADLRDVTLLSLRERIGWVHQDTMLFGMSVAENIALGCPDADSKAIRRVAKQVQAHEFISQMRHGYKTILGQGGHTLSGGQRQRLALARALLRNTPLLLLDEPATGLDELTRRSVEQAWMSSENTATTLVICHRLEQMNRFDRILVLSQGKIEESGTHDELIKNNGLYASLYALGTDEPSATNLSEVPNS